MLVHLLAGLHPAPARVVLNGKLVVRESSGQPPLLQVQTAGERRAAAQGA
jgi:hypothetical protein